MMASNLPFNVKNDKIFWGKESPLTPLILHFHFMYTPPPPHQSNYVSTLSMSTSYFQYSLTFIVNMTFNLLL